MNGKRIGLGLILSGISYAVWQLFNATSKLQFGDIKLKNKQFQLTGLHLTFVFPITNTSTKVALQYDGFDGQLVYGSHRLATINTSEKYILKPKKSVTTTVVVVVKFFELGAIVNMVKSQDFLNAAFIEGNIKSEGLNFPVKQKIF
jgi:hypothetical protein